MPTVGNFTWDSVERPVVDGTQLEVGVGKQYATVQDAVAAASAGDTITVYTDTATQSFIMGTGNVLEVGPGQQYLSLLEAVNDSDPDDIILVYEGDYTFSGNEYYSRYDPDAPVLIQHSLRIVGIGEVNFGSAGDVSKAYLVTSFESDEYLYVENINFHDAWSYSHNGAGIRHSGGDLTVVDSNFINNQDGILSDSGSGTIHVVNSKFVGNGSSGFEHGIYAHGTRVIVENSTFTDTKVGHHIKTVTDIETIIYNNVVADGVGTASYLIDSTGGGDLLVYGNTLTRGANADNRTFIYYDANRSFGEPGALVIQNNIISVGEYPDPNLLTVVVNETDSVVQFLDNTVTGLTQAQLGRGLIHIEGGTLDGVAMSTTPYDDGAIVYTENNDIIVIDTQISSIHQALSGSDTIIGNSGDDFLIAGLGDDLIVGGNGKDTLLGQDGHDTIFSGAGSDMAAGGAGNDLLVAGPNGNRFYGGDGNDTLLGGAQGNILHGQDGDDLIIAGDSGSDRLFGGAGNDTLFAGAGRDILFGDDGDDILVVRGTYDPALFTNNASTSEWKSLAANSTADFAIGRPQGYSELSIIGISDAGMAEAGNGRNYYEGQLQYDDTEALIGIEKVQFDNGVYDLLTGIFSSGLQLVDLDVLTSGLPTNLESSDTLEGTAADDIFLVEAANGFNVYRGLEGVDQVVASNDNIQIRFARFDQGDVETVSSGGYGGVSIVADGANSVLDFSSTTLSGIVGIDAGDGEDTVVGSQGDDTIIGGFGDDSLRGSAGNDTFEIGLGSGTDFIDGGDGVDTIVLAGQSTDLSLSNETIVGTEIEQLSRETVGPVTLFANGHGVDWYLGSVALININSISIYLTSGPDVLVATSGDDTIIGGAGDDSIAGGAGNDTFLVGVGDGLDRFHGGAGNDTVLATADNVEIGLYTDSTQAIASPLEGIETIDASGYTGVRIVGNTSGHGPFRDNIDFSSTTLINIEAIDLRGGNDTVVGSAGDDTIIGGAGDDVIDGHIYNDTLTGGLGSDTFVFHSYSGTDTVTDFEQGDLLDLVSTGVQFSDLTITQVGADTQITGYGGTLNLLGVDATTITANDFVL